MNTQRDPDLTRQKIIEVAAEEMHRHGYKAASLADILAKAGISKGALYHHFSSKQELGYAVFEEVYAEEILAHWRELLRHPDPLSGIGEMVDCMVEEMSDEEMACGCPANNISQEMSATDEGFRHRSWAMHRRQAEMIETALGEAVERGQLRSGLDLHRVALFIAAYFQGTASLVKSSRDRQVLEQLCQGLKDYCESLRA